MRLEHKGVIVGLSVRIRRFAAVFCLTALAACLQIGRTNAESIWGVAGHFLNRPEFFPGYPDYWGVERTLPILQQTKIRWVRDAVFAYTNPVRALLIGKRTDPTISQTVAAKRQLIENYLTAYDNAGVKLVLAILAYRPLSVDGQSYNAEYFDWIADCAARHPSVVAVEMHNEPNLTQFWLGTPEEYVDLYRDAATRIRSRAPNVKIVVGSVANLWWPPAIQWWQRALDHGLLEYADAVSVHPYNGTKPPEVDPFFSGASSPNTSYEEGIQAFWGFIKNNNRTGRTLDLYFTELGYSVATRGKFIVANEAKQADYLSRWMMIYQDVRLRGVPLRGVFWYDFKDDGTNADNEQYNFGLVNYDLSRLKPSFYAYQAIASYFTDVGDLSLIDYSVQVADQAPAVMTKAWRRHSDDAVLIAFWRLDQVSSTPSDFDTVLRITAPAGKALASASAHTASEAPPREINATMDGGAVNLPVRITSRASWIELHFR